MTLQAIMHWVRTGGIQRDTVRRAKKNTTISEMFSLSQNYPNPFNPATTINFTLALPSFVSLKVFDLLGKEVAIIVSEEMKAGAYSRQWNAEHLSSGIYFYCLH